MKISASKKSINASQISGKSGAQIGVTAGSRAVHKPSIPSNLGDETELKPSFNSIGYYGDLLSRLDEQIESTESVYKNTFVAVQHQTVIRD